MTAGWALQKSVYAALAGDAALKALIGDPARVYDSAPASGAYPFIVFGETRETRIAGADRAVEHELRLAVHSRYQGSKEAREIAAAAIAVLDEAALTLDGFRLVSLSHVSADFARRLEPDAQIALLRFRAVTEAL